MLRISGSTTKLLLCVFYVVFFVTVTISKLCQDSRSGFLSSLPRPVDGAVVTSKNERDVDCVVTFQTESILERFMLRFELLAVDCNDRLVVYDGAHAIGNSKVSMEVFEWVALAVVVVVVAVVVIVIIVTICVHNYFLWL